MKRRVNTYFLIISTLMLSFFSACQQEEDEVVEPVVTEETADTNDTSERDLVNSWVYDVMSMYYYWNDEVVAPTSAEQDPEDYFYGQLNSADEFSYITDDYEGLVEEFSGVYTSMGYSPAFGLLSSSSEVFIVVEYVYPGSPAERAGLQRGDIILAIDGQTLNTENYYELYSQSQYTVTLGAYDETQGFSATDTSLSLSAEVIETDPVLYKEVKTYASNTIGYLVYAEFISGDNEEWLSSLGATLDEFAQAGVTDLVVDLRYNPGGEIDAAQYLASALAPAATVSSEEVLVRYDYNELLESSILFYEGNDSENLVSTLVSNGHNLNLNRVYFLTASGTASASELLISGLDPYMDVIIIGESTVGKFYGSWVIPDTEEPARHNWAVMPIVLRYTNAVGVTDFSEGLTPDYPVEDDLLHAKAFGDASDPMLGTALDLISGAFNARMVSHDKPYTNLSNPRKSKKSNLLLNDTDWIEREQAPITY